MNKNNFVIVNTAVFAVVSTHQFALGPCSGLWLFSLCVIHKEGLCPSSGGINGLMMNTDKRNVCTKWSNLRISNRYGSVNAIK
jgi:hypothetical protein